MISIFYILGKFFFGFPLKKNAPTMKRSNEQRQRDRPRTFPQRRNIQTMSKDEKNHVGTFLDMESKMQYSHVNKSRFQESQTDKNLQCFKSTNHFVACSGVFKHMQIGEECLTFCKSHVNEVMKTIINIMFSGNIYTRFENGTKMKLPHPEITIQKSTLDNEEYEVFNIDANDLLEIDENDDIGSWAIEQYDFQNENWFEMQIWFGTGQLHEIFYDFQGVEWELNYSHDYNCISIKNLSYVEEDEGDESEEDVQLEMDEPD